MLCFMQVKQLTGFFFRALAFIGLLALATASAQAVIVNLSTGLDASDSLITLGNTPDAHWTVDQIGGGTAPAKVDGPGFADWPGAWAANGPSSNWIAIDPTTSANAPFLPVNYYRTFTLTPSEVATASISGVWGIDDGGEVRLNGNLLSTLVNDYSATTPFAASAGSGFFVAGINTLNIKMTFSDNVWEAVRLEGTLNTVPEPSTLALLGIGAFGLLAWAWRRNRKAD